ncbi:helix-turn-helix transcriptional regulator [Plantactinospora sp. B5E13]|uniref:helix-turn-helix transcriptional regulator n=1 Tax=Plantactinospora sp. B5E13 TaxID=3153758 RepID=UPI00325DF04D
MTTSGDRAFLDPDAVALYKYAVQHPYWTEAQASVDLGLGRARLTAAAVTLCARRLLRPSVDPDRAWDAVGPEHACNDLLAEKETRLLREQAVLVRVREELLSLRTTYVEALRARMPSGAIEVLPATGTVSRLLSEYARQAVEEVSVVAPVDKLDAFEWLYDTAAAPPRGERELRVRLLSQHPDRGRRHILRRLASSVGADRQVRTMDTVPSWLVLFDRGNVVLPVSAEQPNTRIAVVGHPAVVSSVRTMFEMLWNLASPLSTAPPERGSELRDEMRQGILSHLAAGLKDEVIARRMGLSVRTCRRYIAEIMERLGAASRFQAGVLAERHGFNGPDRPTDERDPSVGRNGRRAVGNNAAAVTATE